MVFFFFRSPFVIVFAPFTHRAVLLWVHVLLLLLLLEPAIQLSVVGGLTSVVLLSSCVARLGEESERARERGRGEGGEQRGVRRPTPGRERN